jgi:hypothetical protein
MKAANEKSQNCFQKNSDAKNKTGFNFQISLLG